MEHLSECDEAAARKPLAAKKDEIFDKIVEIALTLHELYGDEVYKLYSRNGTHPGHTAENDDSLTEKGCLLEEKIYDRSMEEFCRFLRLQPYIENVEGEGVEKCIEAFASLVDGNLIYRCGVITRMCAKYGVPREAGKHLKRAVGHVLNELYTKQKFYPKRKSLPKVQHKAHWQKNRGEEYASDFSDSEF